MYTIAKIRNGVGGITYAKPSVDLQSLQIIAKLGGHTLILPDNPNKPTGSFAEKLRKTSPAIEKNME